MLDKPFNLLFLLLHLKRPLLVDPDIFDGNMVPIKKSSPDEQLMNERHTQKGADLIRGHGNGIKK